MIQIKMWGGGGYHNKNYISCSTQSSASAGPLEYVVAGTSQDCSSASQYFRIVHKIYYALAIWDKNTVQNHT